MTAVRGKGAMPHDAVLITLSHMFLIACSMPFPEGDSGSYAIRAQIAATSTISSTEQPRERSNMGRARP